MKIALVLIVIFTLPCCSTDAQGNKTFLNRNAAQWGDIGFNTGKRTIPIAVEEYNNTASK